MFIHIQIRENQKNPEFGVVSGSSSMVKASKLFRGTWAAEYTNHCTKHPLPAVSPHAAAAEAAARTKRKSQRKKDAQASNFFGS